MICREIDPFLYPYLDGELELAERMEIESHLQACPDCRDRVRTEASLKDLVRVKAAASAPRQLRDKVLGGMRKEHRRERAQLWLKVSAAAVVAIGVTGAVIHRRTVSRERYLADAAIRHAHKLPPEVVQPTPEAVTTWFEGKLDYRVPVPSLTNARITGARISNVRDMPAAYISYQAKDAEGEPRRIGLFVMDDDKGELPADAWPDVEVTNSHGYNVATWRKGEIVYEMVSDLDPSEIRQLLTLPTVPSVHPSGMATASAPQASPQLDVQPAALHP